MGQSVLASDQLGQHGGLPATIVVSTTLQDLESAAGHAVTAGRTRLPMRDVIRLASHSHHYLYIFDNHTNEPLYSGCSKRLASAAQRIVLLSTDRACTFPGCTAPGYATQVHHAARDWKHGGQSNIDEEGWPANRITCSSKTAAGSPAKTAPPNGLSISSLPYAPGPKTEIGRALSSPPDFRFKNFQAPSPDLSGPSPSAFRSPFATAP
jgi:Domain of unknown function (DUF222)